MSTTEALHLALPPQPALLRRCLLYRPSAPSPNGGWPLVCFLHGAGAKGGDLETLARAAAPVAAGLRERAILACPQCPERSGWPPRDVMALLEGLQQREAVDPERCVLTGISMGGRGAYELAYDYADRLSALVPVCAFGIPTLAPRLARLPVWIWHGSEDQVVPLPQAETMAAALQAANAPLRFTPLPGTGHDCGAAVYSREDLWQWALAQRKR